MIYFTWCGCLQCQMECGVRGIPGFCNGLSPQLIPDAHCGHLLLAFDVTLLLFFYIIIVGFDHPFKGGLQFISLSYRGKAPEPFRHLAHLNSSAIYCVTEVQMGCLCGFALTLQFESSWLVGNMCFLG